MSSRFKCPECERTSSYFSVVGTYNEYGGCNGTRNLGDEYDTWDDQDCSESEYDNEEYSCPHCEYQFDYSWVEEAEESNQETYDEDAEEPNEDVVNGLDTSTLTSYDRVTTIRNSDNPEMFERTTPGAYDCPRDRVILDECVGPNAEINGLLSMREMRSFVNDLDRTCEKNIICDQCGLIVPDRAKREFDEEGKLTVICFSCENIIKIR